MAPVNCKARYDDKITVSNAADVFRYAESFPKIGEKKISGIAAIKPVIIPFIANDLNGINGKSAGVKKAPVKMLIKTIRRNGHPTFHALRNKIPEGSRPKSIRIITAARGYLFKAGFSSIGVSSSLLAR